MLLRPTTTATNTATAATGNNNNNPSTLLDPRFSSIPVSEWQPQILPDAQQPHLVMTPTPIPTRIQDQQQHQTNSNSNKEEEDATTTLQQEKNVLIQDDDEEEDSNDDNDIEQSIAMAKCGICHDWIDTCPVGCGNCQQRYCQTCLQTVLQDINTTTNNNNNRRKQPKKCPTCRTPFESVVPDLELTKQLSRITLACRYVDCPERNIPILQYQKHEREDCECVYVACRYAPLGCTFTGPRRQYLQEHEKQSCPYSHISGLLEHVRTMQEQYRQAFESSTQRIQDLTMAVQFLERQVLTLGTALQQQQQQNHDPNPTLPFPTNHQQQQPCNPYNPIDVFYYVVTVLSTTRTFLFPSSSSTNTTTDTTTTTTASITATSSPFHNFIHDIDLRAHVFNTLAMIPTLLWTIKYGCWTMISFDRCCCILAWSTTTTTTVTANQEHPPQPQQYSDCFSALDHFLMYVYE
jgi:hypothetical protein